ncbi:hypothetical protein SAMN05216312_109202 [Cohnella sp. OV330]|uniref:hypothetical protein n=1 Tax=Cohnella sp. OV330 TaxID=1855288 RepID=UPI0008E8DE80|nr:hypothetical protein [Cohnella sp. OV330]SFB47824.1 hypothetical protein SAMN05216312_109202 [Cohnella sp. OV330]
MKKIILVGIVQYFERYIKMLDPAKTEVVGAMIWNIESSNLFQGSRIHSYEELLSWEFDYIIVTNESASQAFDQMVSLGISQERIINGVSYYKSFYFLNQILSDRPIGLFITGLSYAFGLREHLIQANALNLAFAGQDLQLDYLLARALIEKRQGKLPKYAIVGLSYNSFDYDFWMTGEVDDQNIVKRRLLSWPGLVGRFYYSNKHTNTIDERFIRHPVKLVSQLLKQSDLFISPLLNPIWGFDANMELYRATDSKKKIQSDQVTKMAIKVSNKHYPNSVQHNVEVLKAYLTLLADNGIKPILVVHPQRPVFVDHYSLDAINRFRNIVSKMQTEFKFQIIDCFASNMMNEEDFHDIDHLNKDAEERFSNYILSAIEWD